jgi:DNA-directed RNA polymerase subunit RPC12/RpoP
MSEFKFNCPHCDQHLQCDEQYSGRQIQCPSCNHLIRIPAVPGKTIQYQPESGMTWATYVPPGQSQSPKRFTLDSKPNPGEPDNP